MQKIESLIVILKAKKSRFTTRILIAIAVVGIFPFVFDFFRGGDHSIYRAFELLGMAMVLYILAFFSAVSVKIGYSVQLTDDGVLSLVWAKPRRGKILPRLEIAILRWSDMQKWKVSGHLIYLYGSQHRVVINTVLFEDPNEIVKFINKSTGCPE